MTVSAEQRAALARAVSGLRRIFEADYAALAEGKFGIHLAGRRAGEVEDATALSLSAHDLAARSELVGVVEYLRGEGLGAREAVERMVREAVFTTVNRLLAVRVAEAIGVLPQSLAEGSRSEGFAEAVEAFPLLRDADESGGYWTYLQICGDELSHPVPRLFDRRHPLSALVPSSDALDRAVEIMTDPILRHVWSEPEALGWSYQFFNTDHDRRTARFDSAGKEKPPGTSYELAVRNQFFTPRYVVDFLVENTLGRRLCESGFGVDLPLLLGELDSNAPALDLDRVSVLDPAVGSGHFLLGVYDVLERAWANQGVGPADAAPRILRALYGIEIDQRAAQVAQTVLYLRARRSAPDGKLESPVIVTARSLPRDPEVRLEVLEEQPHIVRDLVNELSEALELAQELGSLLKIESVVSSALGQRMRTPKLGDDASGSFEAIEAAVLGVAGEVAGRSAATPAERLFVADVLDAMRFVDICTRRYDVVLMNPPFGKPVPETRPYLEETYPGLANDIYAAFTARGRAWLTDGGLLGAITSRTGFFLPRFKRWRAGEILPGLVCLADLGQGVLDATVEVAAYIVKAGMNRAPICVLPLLDDQDKEAALRKWSSGDLISITASQIEAMPDGVVAYWLPDSLRDLYTNFPALDSGSTIVRRGPYNGDGFRYNRAWWEVTGVRPTGNLQWVPFAKGGEYTPYRPDVHLVVAWDAKRGTFTDFRGRPGRATDRPENLQHFFKPGLTWTQRTQKGLSVRVLPAGCIFSDKGPAILAKSRDTLFGTLGYLNSRLGRTLANALAAFGSYNVGFLQSMPNLGDLLSAEVPKIEGIVKTARAVGVDETSVEFLRVESLDIRRELMAEMRAAMADVDHALESKLPLSASAISLLETQQQPDWVELDEVTASEQLVSYLVGCAMGRWDIRVGRDPSLAPAVGEPFDALPACPPGMLTVEDGMPAAATPDRYPLRLPPDRILHDDPGHEWDVAAAVDAAAAALLEDVDAELRRTLQHLKAEEMRTYLRNSFFPSHLGRYTRSRRKAPIYWYLAVPSRDWGLWVYSPSLSREQLFAITRAAQEKLRRLSHREAQLRRDLERAGGRDVRERLETVEALARELEIFHKKSEAVAQSGWEPDLNDGIILNAAPLEELFADAKWRKDISEHREKLEKGEYPWATVQRNYFDRLSP